MSKIRVLVAASTAIAAESWVRRKIEEAFAEPRVQVTQVGKNAVLTRALEAVGVDLKIVPSSPGALRRSEVRKALSSADHMLLLWDGRTLTELLFEARLQGLPTKVHTIETTEVVNRDRDEAFDAYVGRGTPWGNPFHVGKREGQFERDEAIELYRNHFKANILGDDSLRRGLLSLRGLRIGCHCKPLACHGDVIAQYLNSLDPDDVDAEGQRLTEATYKFERDPQSISGFLSTNRPSTDSLNVLHIWQSRARSRAYDVLRDEDELLEARLTFATSDGNAGQQLDELCLERGVRRTYVAT